MSMIDLSRIIYDGMPKIPVLPDVHVQRFFDLGKGHPLNVTEINLPCHAGTHVDAPVHIMPDGKVHRGTGSRCIRGPGGRHLGGESRGRGSHRGEPRSLRRDRSNGATS